MDAYCIYCGAKAKDKTSEPVCEMCKKIWKNYLEQSNEKIKGGVLNDRNNQS